MTDHFTSDEKMEDKGVIQPVTNGQEPLFARAILPSEDQVRLEEALKRIKNQKQTVQEFQYLECIKVQRAILEYAEHMKTIEADLFRLRERKWELNALKSNTSISPRDVELLNHVPLLATDPASLQFRAGVGDGRQGPISEQHSMRNRAFDVMSAGLMDVAKGFQQRGIFTKPDRRPASPDCPPDTAKDVKDFQMRKAEREQIGEEPLAKLPAKQPQDHAPPRRAYDRFKKDVQAHQKGATPSKIMKTPSKIVKAETDERTREKALKVLEAYYKQASPATRQWLRDDLEKAAKKFQEGAPKTTESEQTDANVGHEQQDNYKLDDLVFRPR